MNYKKYHRDKTYLEEEEHFKNIFQTRFAIVNRYKKGGRILDIGASTGTMLNIFKGHNWETWGVEPSESALRAKEKKHKIIKKYFEDAKLPQNYFDAVIMNHTLEHMKKPEKVLEKVYRILKPGGVLLVDVPNAGGLASKILKDKWPYKLPNEHVSQFTRNSLKEIFEKAGFDVIHFESRSGIFEFANPIKEIWEALIHGKKRFFTDLINIPYDIFVTFFDVGDSMSMVGRKI
jgi:SAM-dependent methyltransferase